MPIPEMISQVWNSINWALNDVSAWEGQAVVWCLRHFIDVFLTAKSFMDVQTQVLGRFDVDYDPVRVWYIWTVVKFCLL
jgi:hypothetical protein